MTWIRTGPALEELARSLESCRAIGLDTESDSLYHHRDKVCLVQIATDRGDAFLVDSLSVDLAPLAPAMADPQLVKELGREGHAAVCRASARAARPNRPV